MPRGSSCRTAFYPLFQAIPLGENPGLTINQSPFQQRKGLCDVALHTASSTLEIPFVPLALAYRLRDYALWVVERRLGVETLRR
ncbi:MAG: PH domain-containing protein [Haliscomenobacter sp.]|nr:PH domain-containing protein [Haliscomenobacter sp.]